MTLSIKNVKTATESEWQHLWEICPTATYFQSPEWARIWREYDPRIKVFAIKALFSDKTELVVPCCYIRVCKGLFKAAIMSPAGTYGGWLTSDQVTIAHGKMIFEYLSRRFQSISWQTNPLVGMPLNELHQTSRRDFTQLIDLKEVPLSRITEKWSKGHKSTLNKARREGVSVFCASHKDEWDAYYQMYMATMKKWRNATSSYKPVFFDLVQSISTASKLWLAKADNTIIAGCLLFYSNNHVVYWHGASLPESVNKKPTHYLIYKIIEDCISNGYQFFDMNPSGGHNGVVKFKAGFGTTRMDTWTIEKTSMPLRALRALKRPGPRNK